MEISSCKLGCDYNTSVTESDPSKAVSVNQESDTVTANSSIPIDPSNLPCCSTQLKNEPEFVRDGERNVKRADVVKHEINNRNMPNDHRDVKPSFASLIIKAEETFNQKLMFNPAVLETIIGPKTNIDVQPAKKRKIRIKPPNSGNISELRRKSEIKSFIIAVKFTLDADSYTIFTSIVMKYEANNDFYEALASLVKLFLSGEETFPDIFKGCIQLFSEEHKLKFQDFLKHI